jgi:hypothetical protein
MILWKMKVVIIAGVFLSIKNLPRGWGQGGENKNK